MSYLIEKDEATAARRRVPCRIFLSDGTSPDTTGLNDVIVMGTNSLGTFSVSSTLRAVNANQGMYCIELTQSEVSVLGTHPLYHTVGDFPQHIATIQVVNSNPMSTLSAISNVTVGAIVAGSYSGVTIQGLSNYANISNVTLAAGTHSNVTIQGLSNYANFPMTSVASSVWSAQRSDFTTLATFGAFTYSQVTGTSSGTIQGLTRVLNNSDKAGYSISGTKTTLDALNDIDGSGVTLHVGTHSGATIQGVTRINSGVTLNADTHSGATIAGIVAGGIIASTLASGTITSAKFAAGAIDAAALATDAGQEIADAVLARNIAGGSSTGRVVSEALYALRNKVLIQGSTMTVYQVDDSTSAWTASITTGTNPLNGMDPVT